MDRQHTPKRPDRLARLADFACRRRRAVLLAWVVALAAAFAASGALAGQVIMAAQESELRGAGDRAEIDALATKLCAEPGISGVKQLTINPAGDTALLMATPTTSPQSTQTADLIRRLR